MACRSQPGALCCLPLFSKIRAVHLRPLNTRCPAYQASFLENPLGIKNQKVQTATGVCQSVPGAPPVEPVYGYWVKFFVLYQKTELLARLAIQLGARSLSRIGRHDSERSESPITSLKNRLRLPLILDSILRVEDEGELLSERLRSALSPRSSQEQHQIRSFARILCCYCDDLYDAVPIPVHQEFDVSYERNQRELKDGDVRVQGDIGPGSPSAEFCAETSRPNAGDDDDLSTAVVASGESASLVGTTLTSSSPSLMSSIEPTTPERTLSPANVNRGTPQKQNNLINQFIEDFISAGAFLGHLEVVLL
ncbi:hypothetical protein BKA56DRAFT_615630 [Ilyonectria sp. MPI-CAGE-AT-0026]|nr:hypothetical protein BKA56DRAFT_615630 [Ilyonectria sp. MPI-CAGE-AT-0026]